MPKNFHIILFVYWPKLSQIWKLSNWRYPIKYKLHLLFAFSPFFFILQRNKKTIQKVPDFFSTNKKTIKKRAWFPITFLCFDILSLPLPSCFVHPHFWYLGKFQFVQTDPLNTMFYSFFKYQYTFLDFLKKFF